MTSAFSFVSFTSCHISTSASTNEKLSGADFFFGGSICSTRLVTGHGIPTLQSVFECAKTSYDVKIIADGGIKTTGDMVKEDRVAYRETCNEKHESQLLCTIQTTA